MASVPSLKGYYLILAVANLVGDGVVFLLNVFTPLKMFPLLRADLSQWSAAGWIGLVAGLCLSYLFVVALMFCIFRLVSRPIAAYIKAPPDTRTPDLEMEAKTRLINLPFMAIAICIGLWLTISVVVFGVFFVAGSFDLRTSIVLIVRTSMVGMIAAAVSFFLIEMHSRRKLIPIFFPKGRLSDIEGAARISIDRRIRMIYRLGSMVPVTILVITLLTLQWQVDSKTISTVDYGRGILVFSLVLFAVFFVTTGVLNRLVSRSIAGPVSDMLAVVDRVQAGDYTARIKVVSNDEIGILGDAGNDMIRGLAERERLRTAFGKYVTPEIGREILSGRIPLGGERREATVMFADLRGFTPYVESNPPEEVIADMRAYFTAMHRAVQAHRGVVLQFVGDEIEAAFGVPVHFDDHADAALRAALDMRHALEELNREFAARGKEPFAHGVGVHTGLVLAGNTGSQDQSAYALIGDTVNVASRIEGLTKRLGNDVLVSQETVDRLGGEYPLRQHPPTEVKGYSKPIVVYSVG